MAYKFLKQSLAPGRYEPEGIYLTLPVEGRCIVVQSWGEYSDFYSSYTYNGVPLKGHNGIDIEVQPGVATLAIDHGRVTGIGHETPGWGRYIKLEHTWGESLYAHLGIIKVESGQLVKQSEKLGTVEPLLRQTISNKLPSFLHFGIRIKPYNRFDGWGGFVDPIPFLDAEQLFFATAHEGSEAPLHTTENRPFSPHPMLIENQIRRRP